jgi:hypothetical protein
VAKQYRGSDGTPEGDKIRYDVIDRRDEWLIEDVRDRDY